MGDRQNEANTPPMGVSAMGGRKQGRKEEVPRWGDSEEEMAREGVNGKGEGDLGAELKEETEERAVKA